ncbi:MAG: hypothetical protein CL687_00275 [Candidatus Pelagibacter sp.]|nr:hypothetical protein [Candidatus Pelagibacter sp.]
MIEGERIRLDIHNILYAVNKLNKKLNNSSILNKINKYEKKDLAFLMNVLLNTMRLHLHTHKIIKIYIKKKIRDHERILLQSAITQIIFLDFKTYAVINCSVEIAKKLKIYHGLINASLKKISQDKNRLKKIEIFYQDFPEWFKKKTDDLETKEKNTFLKNFYKEPDLHIVFKNKNRLEKFNKKIIKTSDSSGFFLNKENIRKIKSYSDGDWWVQDFSSFFALQNYMPRRKEDKILDACSAPGGKAFQILAKKREIILNDKSHSRILKLKTNLKRLRFNAKIINEDFLKFNEKQKYDFIIIDAPCSSIGTIRKNPEIFFKKSSPDFNSLIKIQEKLLKKAAILLNKEGLLLYMVCSFFKIETKDQINKFLKKNHDFELHSFNFGSQNTDQSEIVDNNFMFTLPSKINGRSIDGFFAAYLKKII